MQYVTRSIKKRHELLYGPRLTALVFVVFDKTQFITFTVQGPKDSFIANCKLFKGL